MCVGSVKTSPSDFCNKIFLSLNLVNLYMFLNKNNNRGGIITMQSKQLPYHQTTMGSIPDDSKKNSRQNRGIEWSRRSRKGEMNNE